MNKVRVIDQQLHKTLFQNRITPSATSFTKVEEHPQFLLKKLIKRGLSATNRYHLKSQSRPKTSNINRSLKIPDSGVITKQQIDQKYINNKEGYLQRKAKLKIIGQGNKTLDFQVFGKITKVIKYEFERENNRRIDRLLKYKQRKYNNYWLNHHLCD